MFTWEPALAAEPPCITFCEIKYAGRKKSDSGAAWALFLGLPKGRREGPVHCVHMCTLTTCDRVAFHKFGSVTRWLGRSVNYFENLYRGATLYSVASYTVAALVKIHAEKNNFTANAPPLFKHTRCIHILTYTCIPSIYFYVYLRAGISSWTTLHHFLWNKVCREEKIRFRGSMSLVPRPSKR